MEEQRPISDEQVEVLFVENSIHKGEGNSFEGNSFILGGGEGGLLSLHHVVVQHQNHRQHNVVMNLILLLCTFSSSSHYYKMQGLHEDPGELELLSDCLREMEQPITDEKLQALPVQIPGLCMEKLLRLMNANQIPRLDHKRTLEKMEPDTRNPNMMCFDESFAKRRKFNTEFNREKQLIQDGILHKDWRLPPFFGPHPAVGTFFSTREALQLRKNRAAADAGEEPEHELPSLGNEKDAWGRDWYRH
ncbi:hypothetical protein B484DRAFT_473000, partial [Ochromonadaceae sp. CCMP2298]